MFIAGDMLCLESMVRNATPLETQHIYFHVYLKSKEPQENISTASCLLQCVVVYHEFL
jgi:hypothetical protein